MRAFATYGVNGLKMIVTKDANKITYGINHNAASKNFKGNKMLRIFRRSNGISKTFLKCMNQLGMRGYSISAINYP